MRLQFKGKTPVSVTVLFVLMFSNFCVHLVTLYVVTKWWPVSPDVVHSQAMPFRGGGRIFVQPWLGSALEYSFWATFVILALLFVMMWVHRADIERVS